MARLPLFEIARVFVRFNHIVSFIVNANNGVARSASGWLHRLG